MAVVMGIDPSLTSTGFVVLRDGQLLEHVAFRPRTTGPARLLEIQDQILARIRDCRPELIALEGYAFGVRGGAAFSLGELGGVLRVGMHLRCAKWIEVAPSQVKKFATGKGVAERVKLLEQVAEAAERMQRDAVPTMKDWHFGTVLWEDVEELRRALAALHKSVAARKEVKNDASAP